MSNLSLLYFYIDIEVRQDANGITFRQTHYTKCILELGGMTSYNPACTPMEERLGGQSAQHSGGGRSHTLPAAHRQSTLPGAHSAELGVHRRVHEPVHGAAHGGALVGYQAHPSVCGGHPQLRSTLHQGSRHSTLCRLLRQRPRW